jgi:adrenodoxin-NADP+ reductase
MVRKQHILMAKSLCCTLFDTRKEKFWNESKEADQIVLRIVLSLSWKMLLFFVGHPDFVHIGEHVKRALHVNNNANNLISNSSINHSIQSLSQVLPAHVVIIGQGNVALDCARVMGKGAPGLFDTDIATHALSVLQGGVHSVSIVGRRGHIQGAYTIKELRELTKLDQDGYGVSFIVREDELEMGTTAATLEEMNGPNGKPKQRINKLLHDSAAAASTLSASLLTKCIHLRYLLNPVKFVAASSDPTRLAAVVCERTKMTGPAGSQKAIGTGNLETLNAQLVGLSLKYDVQGDDS